MTQEESWREILALTQKLTQTLIHQWLKFLDDSQEFQRQPLNLIGLRIWLAGLTGLVLLLINWRLVFAMSVGLGSLKVLNWLNQKHWRPLELLFQRGLKLGAKSQTWVIGGSTAATLGAYMAVSILAEADSFWIAVGAILQGLITFAIFCLLIWRIGHRSSPQSNDLDQRLGDLTHADPLKRLIAVRQITRLATQADPDQLYLPDSQLSLRSHLTDCFRLMLRHETETIVRSAVRESLQSISPKPQLPKGSQPIASPITLKRSASHLPHHRVEYVEP